MASPKSIVLLTFLLVALEFARGAELRCKTKEDCRGRMDCIEVEGTTLTCDINGTCACIKGDAVAPNINDADVNALFCKKDKDCQRVQVRCIDASLKCLENKCTCIKT